MSLSEFQKQRCLKVMDEIQSRQISRMFSHPVNPQVDNCPDYFTKIKHPMDLSTSRKKLENGEYETVEQWKNDMELIWNNTFTYNGKTLISTLARELQTLFRELTCNISSDLNSDWNLQFEKLRTEFNQVFRLIPKVPLQKQRATKPSQSNSISNTPVQALNQDFHSNISTSSENTKLSPDELQELANQIKTITDPENMKQIIDLAKRLEPGIVNDDNIDFILDIEKMKDSTLVALKNEISRILNN